MDITIVLNLILNFGVFLGVFGVLAFQYGLITKKKHHFFEVVTTLILVGIFLSLISDFYYIAYWKTIGYPYIFKETVLLIRVLLLFVIMFSYVFHAFLFFKEKLFNSLVFSTWIFIFFISILKNLQFRLTDLVFQYLIFNLLGILIIGYFYKIFKIKE